LHVIRLSPLKNSCPDKNAEKYQYVTTTLHELKHAQQVEREGTAYWNKSYKMAKGIETEAFAEFFGPCELEARIYENENLTKAVELYDKYLANSLSI
jgi:hypothetical protein